MELFRYFSYLSLGRPSIPPFFLPLHSDLYLYISLVFLLAVHVGPFPFSLVVIDTDDTYYHSG